MQIIKKFRKIKYVQMLVHYTIKKDYHACLLSEADQDLYILVAYNRLQKIEGKFNTVYA